MTRDEPIRPRFCRQCGEELKTETRFKPRGYDAYTGAQLPALSWVALFCPDGHESWSDVGGGVFFLGDEPR
jgi:hypothetical protein